MNNRNKFDVIGHTNPPENQGEEVERGNPPSLTISSKSLAESSSSSLQAIKSSKSENPEYPVSAQKTSKLIERLIEELDRKSEAIQKLGQDCLSLRKHASDQEKQIKELRDNLLESDLKTKRLINSFDLDIIPAEEIKRRYALVADKLESALKKLSVANDKLRVLDDTTMEKERTDMENKALRQAHTAQQTLVLDLQDSLQKAQKFKSVIMKQEEVIRQLELSLSKGSLDSFQKGGLSETSVAGSVDLNNNMNRDFKIAGNIPLTPSIHTFQQPKSPFNSTGDTKETQNLEQEKIVARLEIEKESFREKINLLSRENFSLHERISSLEEQIQKTDVVHQKDTIKGGDIPMEMFKLLMRAEASEIKVKALEDQLIESAKAFGRQIKELKHHRN